MQECKIQVTSGVGGPPQASLWTMVQGATPGAASSPSSDRAVALAACYFASSVGAPAIGLIPIREYLAYFECHLCGSQVLRVEC